MKSRTKSKNDPGPARNEVHTIDDENKALKTLDDIYETIQAVYHKGLGPTIAIDQIVRILHLGEPH